MTNGNDPLRDLLASILEGAAVAHTAQAINDNPLLRKVGTLGAAIDRELAGVNIARAFCVEVSHALLAGAEVPLLSERIDHVRKGLAIAARRFAAFCDKDREAYEAAQAECEAHAAAMTELGERAKAALKA